MKETLNSEEHEISGVPTNIITGFLGVGKTTVILNLLKQKPSDERWAVLVNEFGEVGVDGSLIQGKHSENPGVFIREVPGGCMCCASGLTMQIALNQLLIQAKPDRLLIEPTGLGHPKEVLEVLSSDHYQNVLDIQQCITLVDARKVSDSRYTDHDTFNQQIDMADKIISHKSDLYGSKEQRNLKGYVTQRRGQLIPVFFAQKGDVDAALLEGKSNIVANLKDHRHNHRSPSAPSVGDRAIPECGFLKAENSGEGYQSVGWRFLPEKIFNRSSLLGWLSELKVERAKGVFITSAGVFGYNVTPDAVTEIELDDCLESRIEIIVCGEIEVSEEDLLQCVEVCQSSTTE